MKKELNEFMIVASEYIDYLRYFSKKSKGEWVLIEHNIYRHEPECPSLSLLDCGRHSFLCYCITKKSPIYGSSSLEFDKNDNYVMCDNKDFDNKNGICEIGIYKIIDGDYFEKNTTIELYLDHYYKDGNYIVADIIGPRNVNLERMEKYKYSRVFIDEQTNEIFNVSSISLDKLNYDY